MLILLILLPLCDLLSAQNETTFFTTRDKIEEYIPLEEFYCIHYNETFILKLDDYFHAPGLKA